MINSSEAVWIREDCPRLQKQPEICSGSPTGASPVFARLDPSRHIPPSQRTRCWLLNLLPGVTLVPSVHISLGQASHMARSAARGAEK